ncbi:SafA/ExsA family spore coat assembly protein [Pseudogracilibacillus sp. SE30717A]|uniref:SafA/ExsA family spore coat assembly protein n=1 Tax=Pseudogracilibacillus sp. SE30717A TaxID=3098293 RepID=UPI00300E63CE
MRIHIVQKGDTLFDIAKKYNVNFEDIVRLNSQLSSPDMIMPGMKIKIPSESKQVRSEMREPKQKEVRTPMASEEKSGRKELNARTAERPMGSTVRHDDKERRAVRPEMPKNIEPLLPATQPPRMPTKLETEKVLSEEKKGTEYKATPHREKEERREEVRSEVREEVQSKPHHRPMECPEPMYMTSPEMGMAPSMCNKTEMSMTRPMAMGMESPMYDHKPMHRPMQQGMEQPMYNQMQMPMTSPMMMPQHMHCCCCCHSREPMFGPRQPFSPMPWQRNFENNNMFMP